MIITIIIIIIIIIVIIIIRLSSIEYPLTKKQVFFRILLLNVSMTILI